MEIRVAVVLCYVLAVPQTLLELFSVDGTIVVLIQDLSARRFRSHISNSRGCEDR